MKAVAVLPAKREISLIDNEQPKLVAPTQAKLKILDVGVCGTDREICSFQYGTPPAGSEHLIIGHKSLGEVVEVGSSVSGLKQGDLVVTTVRRPCSHDICVSCVTDHADFCYTGDFVARGIKNHHGLMTSTSSTRRAI